MRMPAHTVVLVQSRTLSRTTTTERTANEWIVGRSVGLSFRSYACSSVILASFAVYHGWQFIQLTRPKDGWVWCGFYGTANGWMMAWKNCKETEQGKLIASNVVIHLYMHKRKNYGLSAGRTVVAPVVWFGWLAGYVTCEYHHFCVGLLRLLVAWFVMHGKQKKNEKYGKTTFSSLFCCSRVESIKNPIQRMRPGTDWIRMIAAVTEKRKRVHW